MDDSPVAPGVPWPFEEGMARTAGTGMRPGQLTVIAARPGQGKSILADQCLDSAVAMGQTAHAYLLEMSEAERVERCWARASTVPYSRIVEGRLTPDDRVALAHASQHLGWGITECAGWSPGEVARHARHNRADVVLIDHLHRFSMPHEADVAEAVRIFRDLAADAGIHVLLAAQLNEKRVTGQQRPTPTLTDLRGSGMIAAEAHHVLFVHRPDDEEGREGDEGIIFFAKNRATKSYGGASVVLNGERMRFDPDRTQDQDRPF